MLEIFPTSQKLKKLDEKVLNLITLKTDYFMNFGILKII